MLKKAILIGALATLAGPVQAATINGTFSAALAEVSSSTFGIGVDSIFTNSGATVESTTDEFGAVANGTSITLSTVTATNGTPVSFSSSFGTFFGNIIAVDTDAAPFARVGLNAFGTFTPLGDLGGFDPGDANLTLSFTQTGFLDSEIPPSISGSFTFASPALVAGVPEPASWAMLIAGFGLTGAALRRRRATVTA